MSIIPCSRRTKRKKGSKKKRGELMSQATDASHDREKVACFVAPRTDCAHSNRPRPLRELRRSL